MSTADDFIPILLYHSVAETPAVGQERFTVTPSAFREHVKAIADAGRSALTVSELAAALRGQQRLPSRPAMITFDDGFADVVPAVEQLLSSALSATVFVTAGTVDHKPMLSSAELRGLSTLGADVEVGAHTMSHPYLDEIRLSRATQEIRESKEAIEAVTATGARTFAYPHGAYNRAVREEVISAGFSSATAVKDAFSHRLDDPYALARLTITASTTTQAVETLLGGSGAPIAWSNERLRTRAFRAYRRARRKLRDPRPVSAGFDE